MAKFPAPSIATVGWTSWRNDVATANGPPMAAPVALARHLVDVAVPRRPAGPERADETAVEHRGDLQVHLVGAFLDAHHRAALAEVDHLTARLQQAENGQRHEQLGRHPKAPHVRVVLRP